jgi:hypothetical protein
MEQEAFRELLLEHLVPMLSGTRLGASKQSVQSHALVAYAHPCALLLKPSKEADYRIELLRSQPFASEEKRLVEIFAEEFSKIAPQARSGYFGDLMASLPRRVISKLLPGTRGRSVLEQAIQRFEALASETYEGRPVVSALGLTGTMGHGRVTLDELWKEDFARVLSNGFDSMYVCGSDGRVFNLACLAYPPSVSFSPHRLGSIAAWCKKPQRVAVVLNRNGEVLIFKDKQLQFAKRRGAWRHYAHESVVSRLGVGNKNLRRAVYESCLDVSFARAGGCIAVLSAKGFSRLDSVLKQADLITRRDHTRTKLLSSAIKRPFQKIDRRLRQELLSMDGATVLRHTGEVLAAGSIVRVPGGSTSGGRRAAAVQLSKLGLAVKISADGPIIGFRNQDEIFVL